MSLPTLKNGHDALAQQALLNDLIAIQKGQMNKSFQSIALAITGGGTTTASRGGAFKGIVEGQPVTSAGAGVMPVLVGTILNGFYNVYCFYVSKAGAFTSLMGTAAATPDLITWPTTPTGTTMCGFIVVQANGANFVGGTTALDAGTANVVYYNVVGSWEPSTVTL